MWNNNFRCYYSTIKNSLSAHILKSLDIKRLKSLYLQEFLSKSGCQSVRQICILAMIYSSLGPTLTLKASTFLRHNKAVTILLCSEFHPLIFQKMRKWKVKLYPGFLEIICIILNAHVQTRAHTISIYFQQGEKALLKGVLQLVYCSLMSLQTARCGGSWGVDDASRYCRQLQPCATEPLS